MTFLNPLEVSEKKKNLFNLQDKAGEKFKILQRETFDVTKLEMLNLPLSSMRHSVWPGKSFVQLYETIWGKIPKHDFAQLVLQIALHGCPFDMYSKIS